MATMQQGGLRSNGTYRPFPDTPYTGMFRMCNGSCRGSETCSFPHSEQEMEAWNKECLARRKRNPPVRNQRYEVPLRAPTFIQQATAKLTRENYKEKYQSLLWYENQAHIDLLNKKCNGEYVICLRRSGAKKPDWMKQQLDNSWYRRVGYVKMDGDRIAYAVQATRRFGAVYLQHKGRDICSADILQENYSHAANRLYIAFDTDNANKLRLGYCPFPVPTGDCEFKATLRFELKHSYFQNLYNSVGRISDQVVEKILPCHENFTRTTAVDLSAFEKICSKDQLKALEVIASCPPYGPPVVIAGPFGTGKSYLLAVAARYFIREGKSSATILVCTQQRVSADSFASMYLKMHVEDQQAICIVRSYGQRDHLLKKLYWSVDDFRRSIERGSRSTQRSIVVTTCQTARSLARFVHAGYFTHILIDEGAQMREPEAIAPLSMADPVRTKIVIAGDEQQIGPSMLVLGDLPLKHGLSESLLERLHNRYRQLGGDAGCYHASLVTNHRSRSEILDLTGELFYNTKLKVSGDQEPPAHLQYPYPLAFTCSSEDDTVTEVPGNTNRREAEIVVNTLAGITKNWSSKLWGPFTPSSLCVISPSRAQLTVTNECIDKKKMSKLKRVRRHPTYDIQGREFRALVLSTAEPTNEDASTKNPLKSLSDRHVFNTAITRSQSLVVGVGNPFLLLKMEDHMMEHYPKKGKRCWSNFLKRCLSNGTVSVDPSLKLTEKQKTDLKTKLDQFVRERLPAALDVPITIPKVAAPSKLPVTPKMPQTKPPMNKDTAPSPPEEIAAVPSITQVLERVALESIQSVKSGECRSNLNDLYHKKLISKPTFDIEERRSGGFTCTVAFEVGGEKRSLKSDPTTSKVGAKENAASKALEGLKGLGDQTVSKEPIGLGRLVSTGTSRTSKRPLAMLKELCDKQRLTYEVRSISGKQSGFKFTITVKEKMSSQSKFMVSGEEKTNIKDAKHNAAEEAINLLSGKNQQNSTFKIEEPESECTSTSVDSTHVELEKKDVPDTRASRGAPVSITPRQRLEEEFEFIKTVGHGGFGVVHQVRYKTDSREYALKIVKLPPWEEEQEKVMQEAKVLAILSHQNILRYNYSWKQMAPIDWKTRDLWKPLQFVESMYSSQSSSLDPTTSGSDPVIFQHSSSSDATDSDKPPTCLCILTEFCKEGTLEDWLTENKQRKRKVVMKIFEQILLALSYLHEETPDKEAFIHRDLKPSNIFFRGDDVKLGDLGLAKVQSPTMSLSTGGTLMYQSPEQKARKGCNEKIDMYALGLILFELLYPIGTSSEKSEKFKSLKEGAFPDYFKEKLPDEAAFVIQSLVKKKPKKRLGASELLSSQPYKMFKKKMEKEKKDKFLPTF